MTPLGHLIAARIAATGPITVADYMADCLLHPTHGYYATREPFGTKGDFITAPEISQMFGEVIGLALVQVWQDQGSPARIALAELGPGRGTLMADILRATARVPGFHDAAALHLVEASSRLRAVQAKALGPAIWHDTAATLPEVPLYLIANEFFDALPVRQYIRDGAGWAERVVGQKDGALAWGLRAAPATEILAQRMSDTNTGDMVEVCPGLPAIVTEIDRRIGQHGGVALIIDYGDWHSQGDTLQAMQGHAPIDPLAAPGLSDVTTHVDFEAIAATVRASLAPTRHSKLTPQGVFLERLGITARANRLAAQLPATQLDAHILAHRRLTHPSEMGHLFKVIGIYPASAPPPPGCEQ